MISVIIPTFNRSDFLGEAIRSVLDQDYFRTPDSPKNFEIIVIDDGSTDETGNVVNSIDFPIRYISQENRGVSAARNVGLQHAKGNFIAFLDSDDLWQREKIAVQMSLMNTLPRAMVCYTEETWIRHGIFVNPKARHRKFSGWIFDKVLPLCLISLSSALFRREVFAKISTFDEDFPVCEDYEFGIRLTHQFPVYFITRPLIVKRGGHADQLSKRHWGMDRFRIKALEKALSLDLTPLQRELVQAEIIKKSRVLMSGFAKRGKTEEAEHYRKLIALYSSSQKNSDPVKKLPSFHTE